MKEHVDPGGYLENVGLFMTYKCQVACAHCLVQAGPHRKEAMREDDAVSWMQQAAAYHGGAIKAVNFTGGEPFVDLDAFRRLVHAAAAAGLFPTVATNAHWAISPAVALETLKSLPELLFVQISADEHHQLQIPFERVLNAIGAAQRLELVYRVVMCTEDERSPGHTTMLARLMEVTDAAHIETVLTFPVGRAAQGRLARRRATTCEVPTGACAGADSPIIFPDGRVVSCVGPMIDIADRHPLVLGNLREQTLADILDEADGNPLLHFVRVWGPGSLHELLCQRGLAQSVPRRFIAQSMCDLCYRLFSDVRLRDALREVAQEAELVETIARGRLRYLDEDRMARRLGLA